MPDPQNKTISASEAPALFNVSPYFTRWQLWHRFAGNKQLDRPDDNRLSWGKDMQPLILRRVAEEMRLEVIPNENDSYVRRGLLGCTRDAVIVAPDRGPGALEIKCVFDYRVWMTRWNGGHEVPNHNEIQLQQQMLVGDGNTSFSWGLVVAWVCADLYFFERKPIPDLWTKLNGEAESFFDSVIQDKEPDPFGSPLEIAWITEMFPTVPESVLDLSNDPAHVETANDVSMYVHYQQQESGAKTAREPLRAKLLALAQGNAKVLLPCGVNYKVVKAGKTGKKIDAYVPEVPGDLPAPDEIGVLHGG